MPHRAAPPCRCGPKSHAHRRGAAPRRGSVHGGNWFTDTWGKIRNEFENPNSVLRGKYIPALAHEFTDPNSKLRGELVDQAAAVLPQAAAAKKLNDTLKSIGLGRPGAVHGGWDAFGAQAWANKHVKQIPKFTPTKGAGRPRAPRAPTARNLVVRDVMREKGLSLPDASAYVKAHKLA